MSGQTIKLGLSRTDLFALADSGLNLFGLEHTGSLAPRSFVEAPTCVAATVTPGAFLQVGAFSNLSGGTLNHVRIGRYCSMADGVVTGRHEHPMDWLTTSRLAYLPDLRGWDRLMWGTSGQMAASRPIPESCPTTTLGNDVWVGQGAFLRAGVTIGHGAVIGAHTTVLEDVPPYAVVAGVPGKVKRVRFPEGTVQRLLELQWWTYNIYDFFDAPLHDVDRAIDMLQERIEARTLQPFTGARLDRETLASPDKIKTALAHLATARG